MYNPGIAVAGEAAEATASTFATLLITEVPTPFLDLTPKYKAVVEAEVTPEKLTKISVLSLLITVP